MKKQTVMINRAPVLTLWATVVAERLGHDPDDALTLGKAVAGLNAQAKGRRLGIFTAPKTPSGRPAPKHGLGEDLWIELCGRSVPAVRTESGTRAVVKEKPIEPEMVRTYLSRAFGEDLAAVRRAFERLADAFGPDELGEKAYALYEAFRPTVARGQAGWGQKGELDLGRIRELAKRS